MLNHFISKCGLFFVPQLLLSVTTFGLLLAYFMAWLRRELFPGEMPWEKTLEPLSGIAVTIGLLGSVVGFIVAFGGFQNGLDIETLTRGLGAAYYTTGFGIVTSLAASLGSYVLSVLNK